MLRRLMILVLVAVTCVPATAQAHEKAKRPIVFVHGFSGSGSQFETQARRFAGNGYPAGIIEAHEYDSTFMVNTVDQVYAGLDARIARLLSQTGADKVDLLAHSLGTTLMQGYLNSSPDRAAKVAHYVNLDGAVAAAQPGGVPTLAIWGEGNPARAIVGATNVYLSDQSHTQTVTSTESFSNVFRFFTGENPRTTRIVSEPPGHVRLSGRAVLFPLNVGVPEASLEIWEVGGLTGHREHKRPEAVFPISGNGDWGPFKAKPNARYEFAIVRAGASTHHFYYEPFRRSDNLIRLLTSTPGGGLGSRTEMSETTTNLVISRNKEWWGDQGDGSDSLWVNGGNILNAANAPRSKRVIAMFAYDAGLDGVTDLTAPIPFFFSQPFITGMDVHIPASPNGAGTAWVLARQRSTGAFDLLGVPNWPSAGNQISLQLNDYP